MEETCSAGPNGAEPDQDQNNNKWSGMGSSGKKKRMGDEMERKAGRERRGSKSLVAFILV
jgi:hypothetical protein